MPVFSKLITRHTLSFICTCKYVAGKENSSNRKILVALNELKMLNPYIGDLNTAHSDGGITCQSRQSNPPTPRVYTTTHVELPPTFLVSVAKLSCLYKVKTVL